MKKLFLSLVILFSVFLMVGCVKDTTATTTTTTSLIHRDGVQNLYIEDSILTYDALSGADQYIITVSGESYTTNSTSFDLSFLSEGELYLVGVVAVFGLEDTSPVSMIYFDNQAPAISSANASLDLSDYELPEFVLNQFGSLLVIMKNGHEYTDYSYVSGILTFTESSLLELGYGTHSFRVFFEDGLVVINITLFDTRAPYLISSNQVFVTIGSDATVEFELYGGQIMEVTGNGITSEDYSISGNLLTIDGSFIQMKFVSEPERTTLILGYTLKNNDQYVIGYLFIKILEE